MKDAILILIPLNQILASSHATLKDLGLSIDDDKIIVRQDLFISKCMVF